MPDTDAMGFLCTLQGEQSMVADQKRREAHRLRQEADGLDRQAEWHEERAAWLGEAFAALTGTVDD